MRKFFCLVISLILTATATAQSRQHISDRAILPYTTFLNSQHTSACNYIIELFEQYDIVILCERDHREITQYNLILEVLSHPYFIGNVGQAYFEIGNTSYNDTINRFLHNNELSQQTIYRNILNFHRNIYSPALWEKTNYSYLLEGVYNINKNLDVCDRINIYGLEQGVNWDTATVDLIRQRNVACSVANRDSVLAANFTTYYERAGSNKALIILNYRHAFTIDIAGRHNAGRYIKDQYGDRVANVYINSFVIRNDNNIYAAQNGLWDAAFTLSGKDNIGFDLQGTPFGLCGFDLIPIETEYQYSDIFTGMVYYTGFGNMQIETGRPDFIDNDFAIELQRRQILEGQDVLTVEELKQRYNTTSSTTYQEEFPTVIESINLWLE